MVAAAILHFEKLMMPFIFYWTKLNQDMWKCHYFSLAHYTHVRHRKMHSDRNVRWWLILKKPMPFINHLNKLYQIWMKCYKRSRVRQSLVWAFEISVFENILHQYSSSCDWNLIVILAVFMCYTVYTRTFKLCWVLTIIIYHSFVTPSPLSSLPVIF